MQINYKKKEFDARDYIIVNKFEEYGINDDDLLAEILVEKTNEKVSDMRKMFYKCTSLIAIDFSPFNKKMSLL